MYGHFLTEKVSSGQQKKKKRMGARNMFESKASKKKNRQLLKIFLTEVKRAEFKRIKVKESNTCITIIPKEKNQNNKH